MGVIYWIINLKLNKKKNHLNARLENIENTNKHNYMMSRIDTKMKSANSRYWNTMT